MHIYSYHLGRPSFVSHKLLTRLEQAGQQVVLLEGVESMAKIPAEVKDRTHAEFMPPLSYGPLD